MNYCKRCIMPDTRPDQYLGKDGVCNACLSFEYQKENPYWKDDVDVRLYYATPTPWIFCRNFRLIEEN